MKRVVILLAVIFCSVSLWGEEVLQTAVKVAAKGWRFEEIEDYKGLTYFQGLAEAALVSGNEDLLRRTLSIANDYAGGKYTGRGSFMSYRCGGNAMPMLVRAGYSQYSALTSVCADTMWKGQKRNRDGLMVPPWPSVDEKNPLFVDCALGVTPFLLWQGLNEGRGEYIDFAAKELLEIYDTFLDSSTGLLHQARACEALPEGEMTRDNWSRGNGWAALCFGILLRDLPRNHHAYKEVRKKARAYFRAILKFQDADGLWHQEMSWPESYQEISGSSLMLYGIGSGIETGVLPKSCLKAFKKGLAGLMDYIADDGTVGNTCLGCIAPGGGSKEAYASHPYYTNEPHAFGPVLLCLAQALRLGIKETPAHCGSKMEGRIPACHVRQITERKNDIAWENDRMSFRVYSMDVRHLAGSGVDYWGKRVEYPTLENWYSLNAQGQYYHIDRGEGCDFYVIGYDRGLGGSGIWNGDSLYVSEPYANYRIYADGPDKADFEISYQPFKAGEETVYEKKRIRIILGTNFYEVTHTLESESGAPLTLAVGVMDFGNADVMTSDASLALVENMDDAGTIGSAVVGDPSCFEGFAQSGKNRMVLMNVPSGTSVTYYVGVDWEKTRRRDPFLAKWYRDVKAWSWSRLNDLYR
ncbi:MAG: DUF4861 family protein [Bacteroidales bacterium]|nr:DUF4861 family protein [Bacteroidales bacterium]